MFAIVSKSGVQGVVSVDEFNTLP